ncbi:MAG: phenylacetic acid degradation protein [Chloroflexota bacterium]
MDTQWPRYEVFKQDSPHKAHEAVGSVHAPDAEMALLQARDVFVRRPSAVSLWVVPETAVFAITAEEIAANPVPPPPPIAPHAQTYLVFTKTSQRRSMTFVRHVGEIVAATPQIALQLAMESGRFNEDAVFVWWLVPESAITRSEPGDIDSLFTPAHDKTYRQQSYYGFVSPTRNRK